MTLGAHRRYVDLLDVECWCHTHIGKVTPEDVREGRTWQCTGPICVPLKGHETARRAA